jgi:two-component system sensor histidine kinase KdpD
LLREAIQAAGTSLDGQAACLPLTAEERVAGALVVWGTDLQEADVPALSILAAQVASAFDRARLARQAAEIEILREVDRLRSELIANVSHELRTPLGLIEVCCTSLLMDDVALEPDTQRGLLVGIREETDRLKAIVNNLLNLSRLEGGRWRLHRQPTDLGRLAREVAVAMEPQLTGHHLVCSFPSSPVVANAEPRQIQQVLGNLLSNAVKYSPGGGTICVEGWADGGQTVICVHDEGIGIPPEEKERVFERFYRVDCEGTQSVPGAGLGLAVCKGIVEAHGGRIWIEQSSLGGSTLCFTLPASPTD